MSKQQPDFQTCIISREKVVGYLLNFERMPGAAKARFFAAFGFSSGNWEFFVDALREQARNGSVNSVVKGAYGTKLEVDGPIAAPDGRSPIVRTVWQIDEDGLDPRLITAYPLRK